MRNIPQPLYCHVRELALALANAVELDDLCARRGAYRRLRSLYRSRLGEPDPFLTETLADFTTAPRTAAKLYRLAIQQSSRFPDEDIHTKQIGLARVLVERGATGEASMLVQVARKAATELADAGALDEIGEIESALQRLEVSRYAAQRHDNDGTSQLD